MEVKFDFITIKTEYHDYGIISRSLPAWDFKKGSVRFGKCLEHWTRHQKMQGLALALPIPDSVTLASKVNLCNPLIVRFFMYNGKKYYQSLCEIKRKTIW